LAKVLAYIITGFAHRVVAVFYPAPLFLCDADRTGFLAMVRTNRWR
jgi:hypothetical protein